MGKVGPSMLLTSASEIFCFGIGALSNMPAVHTFAMYATIAVLFNLVLQLTAFVALLALDEIRYEVIYSFIRLVIYIIYSIFRATGGMCFVAYEVLIPSLVLRLPN